MQEAVDAGIQPYYSYDQHWTPEGNIVAAREVGIFLQSLIKQQSDPGHSIERPARLRVSMQPKQYVRQSGAMNSSRLRVILAAGFMSVLPSCVTGDFDDATPYKQEAGDGHCHIKLQPVGPTDPARPTQSRSGDFIDYYGPCDGPSVAEQIRKQRRFERFRFGRDYMPG